MVTLLDVLEHVEDDAGFLESLADKMAVGSRLILTVPAMPSLWSGFDEDVGHFKRYTKRKLRDAASNAPLRPVEVSYLFPEMVPAAILRKRQQPPGGEAVPDKTDAMVAALADIPDIGRATNRALYSVGIATQEARRLMPIGSSIFAVYERA